MQSETMKDSAKKAKLINSRAFMRNTGRVLLSMGIATATVIGCGWSGTSHSVRFNDYQTERELGRLPPLPTMANGLNERRASWDMDESLEGEDAYELAEKRSKELDGLWVRAEAAETNGNLRLDRDLLNEYLGRTEITREVWDSHAASQVRRNSAIDRVDALSTLELGSDVSKLRAYLNARRIHDSDKPVAEEVKHALGLAQSDFNLRDNVAYLKAAELYRQEQFPEAAAAFDDLVRHYSHSEKREAALFMAAVARMKTSVTFIPASGQSDYVAGATASSSPDEAWHDAFAAFQKLMRDYPRGRYFNEARGWLAYLMLRTYDRAGALVEYYRLLADKNENARIEAAFSLMLVRSSATDDEMSQVERDLANEPEAALAYAYHNIYNYSIDPGDADPPYEPDRDSQGQINYEVERLKREEREKEWQKNRAQVGRKELTRTLDFSKRLITSYPNLSIGGGFALRAAQASEEMGDNVAAANFAQRALKSRLTGDERAQALWTLGIAQHRRRTFDSARKNFAMLLRDYPQSPLTEGARRALAMIAEDAGDIDGALEQYLALKYTVDIAYFVDTLMTPEELANFIQRHPDSPKKNELSYALGLRYLRANRWDDARRTLGQIRTAPGRDYDLYYYRGKCTGEVTINCTDPKVAAFDDQDNPIVTARLVMRDIQTANDLEALEQHARHAEGDEAKAEALYQLASYQYEASSLLFYNPLASPGYWNLSLLAGGKYRMPNESQILWNSTQEHERLARALNIYLDVVNRFPRTRAARDSLYTAAVCHERLSNYNPYWREIYQNGLHAGQRMVTYQDVKAAYPNYQLPRGTFGWQPSLRTVNGGPGWQAPPKPPLRLTKTARAKRLVQRLADRFQIFWRETGRRWLTEIVIALGLWFTARIAARNRRRLRARIARHCIEQSRQAVTYPWLEMFCVDPVKLTRREHLRKFLREKRETFLELARDTSDRPLLVGNVVSHSLLMGLLAGLIWTAAAG